MNSIFTRRSIRKYLTTPVEDEKIQKLLKAGMAAPSAHNQQPWHFIVVNDKEKLSRIANSHPYAKMLHDAPLAIIICTSKKDEMKNIQLYPQDCSAATQNILLMAEELNLGSCWIGVYPTEERMNEIRKAIELNNSIEPFSVIALGYKGEEKKSNTRFDEKLVHYNNW